jgi:hypothetical protein
MRSKSSAPRQQRRVRRGSALILVLIMTMSLAGLAISAIYLTSSSGLLTRYYDKERDYRFAAEAALALGKSRVLRDSALGLPEDSAKKIITAGTLVDAGGTNIPRIKVNLYGAYTGDTIGRFGQFVTLLATAFDSGGVRHVRRLDLTSESFSRFAMFVDSFPSGIVYGTGEYIRGRAHSNTDWNSDPSSPGPDYYDTVSAVGAFSGTANFHGLPNLAGVARIPYPTVAKLAILPAYATTGNLNFTPVSNLVAASANNGLNMSGRTDAAQAQAGTRVRFKPVDVGNDGTIDEQDGMMMIFDAAPGIDTSSLRADLPNSGGTAVTNIVMLNQCGLLITNAAARKEFYPVARFRESWVLKKVRAAVQPPISNADTLTMKAGNAAAYSKILSYGPGFSRCFPAGSPYLMLTERMTTGACVPTTALVGTFYAWGSATALCTAAQQYGGQDTTFTPTVTRCRISQALTTGACTNQVTLGSWRAWTGAALPGISPTLIQAVEVPYLWPLFKPYNLNSKGVIHATSGPIFMSDTLRGNVTFYALGTIEFIDDLVYDQNPTVIANLCRNFLGIIARDNVMISDNSMNRPRQDPSGNWVFLGPDMNMVLNMVTMSLTGTVGVENWGGNQMAGASCTGHPQSGGCINQTGGVIHKVTTPTYAGDNTGLRENRTVDPCQLTNRRPPFFPTTGRYIDNKYYEIDPVNVDTWAQVKAFYQRLRGHS